MHTAPLRHILRRVRANRIRSRSRGFVLNTKMAAFARNSVAKAESVKNKPEALTHDKTAISPYKIVRNKPFRKEKMNPDTRSLTLPLTSVRIRWSFEFSFFSRWASSTTKISQFHLREVKFIELHNTTRFIFNFIWFTYISKSSKLEAPF